MSARFGMNYRFLPRNGYGIMENERLHQVLRWIDEANSADPNFDHSDGKKAMPKELLYGLRMTAWLERLRPEASDILRIAARGQHLRRWEVPRDSYPATREGYLQWRSFLYGFHGERVGELMERAGYEQEAVERAKILIGKRGIKRDPEVQMIEDIACLVFLEHYFPHFADTQDAGKLPGIVRKTWNKMSEEGRSYALTLDFPEPIKALLVSVLEAT